MCFIHCVVRARLDTNPRKEATSRSAKILCKLFQVVDMIVTNSARVVSEILRVRSVALMHVPIWVRIHEHVFLMCLFMDSGFRRRCDSGLPRSVHRDSMLQARDGFRCTKIPASRLSSINIAFWVGPLLPFDTRPLLKLSSTSCTRRWGHFSVSLGSLMRSMIALFLCTIVGRSDDDYKYSTFLQQNCESTS